MTDYLKHIFGQLVAGLLAYASRLARLAALRQVLEESTAALEEAAHLETKGHSRLASYIRAELDDTLGTALSAGPERQPALNSNGAHDPFALPRPTDAAASRPEGEGTAPPRRRRRPPGTNGAKPAGEQPPPREQAALRTDQTVSPDQHL